MNYLITILIIAIGVLLLTKCSKLKSRVYVVEKGNHYCNNRKVVKTNGFVNFKFTFTKEHRYKHLEDSDHINKLFGLTSLKIHKNSARIGYVDTGDAFDLYAYYYLDGKRTTQFLYSAKESEELIVTIDTRHGGYFYNVNGRMFETKGELCKYVSNPYFGGEPIAPKEFRFDIEPF